MATHQIKQKVLNLELLLVLQNIRQLKQVIHLMVGLHHQLQHLVLQLVILLLLLQILHSMLYIKVQLIHIL